jgi:hypothetical protein
MLRTGSSDGIINLVAMLETLATAIPKLSYIYKFLVLIYFSCIMVEQIQYNDFYTSEIKLYFLDFQALTGT